MQKFFVHFLLILSAWTLLIKFIFPISYGVMEGLPWFTYVMWDFWWVAHLWLAWAFWARPRYFYKLALSIAVLEVAIILVKFFFFLNNPDWNMWTANWFVNKIFVLSCFLLMLGYLLRAGTESGKKNEL